MGSSGMEFDSIFRYNRSVNSPGSVIAIVIIIMVAVIIIGPYAIKEIQEINRNKEIFLFHEYNPGDIVYDISNDNVKLVVKNYYVSKGSIKYEVYNINKLGEKTVFIIEEHNLTKK